MNAARRILLVDDNEWFRTELASLIDQQPDIHIAGQAADGWEAFEQACQLTPDLILMDLQMPGCDGLQATRRIKQERPDSAIVMLSSLDDDEDDLFQALKSGAQGHLAKDAGASEIIEMLRGAIHGQVLLSSRIAAKIAAEFSRERSDGTPLPDIQPLTPRERQILYLIAEGISDKGIAIQLQISDMTVDNDLRNILAKLHRHNQAPSTLAVPNGADKPPVGLD